MKIIECVQGTPEWFSARCGIPSASNFDKIITTKGEPSKQKIKYLYQLAGETITGIQEETYKNGAMIRGSLMEAEARKFYQFRTDEIVTEVGFCVTDGEFKCGASPDGLSGSKGTLEIKCPTLAVHVGYLLDNCLPSEYFQQVQGQLFVTGREWADFVSYYPGIRPLLIRVERDEKFIKSLSKELNVFCLELEDVIKKIR